MQSSVEYLGKIITKEGIQPSQKKIEAILKVKEPTDSTQLKSFLGMVNHYSKFLKCLADLSAPLNNLDREIENCAKQCITCQENSKNLPKSQLYPWETATQTWKVFILILLDLTKVTCGLY